MLLVVVACNGGDSASSPATLPLAEPPVEPDNTGPANDLAPSQIAAPTVPAPDIPEPCALVDLELWTAQVSVAEAWADAVVRVRNTGDVWCEPDIGGSPLIDPAIEPDVWLDPGGWADLVVGQSGRECFDPAIVSEADIDIHGEAVVVPTSAIAMCGWRLTAFFPTDIATDPCEQLDTTTVADAVLIRNPWFTACELGVLSAAEGNGVSTTPRIDDGVPMLADLAGGDVVAIRFVVDGTVDCDVADDVGTLTFEAAGTVKVESVACGSVFEIGAARPWYGAADGPLALLDPDSFDLDEALALLSPFS
jgi:hypothetical protein